MSLFSLQEHSVSCTSNPTSCEDLFTGNYVNDYYWGVSQKNDSAQITFENIVFLLTSYTLRGHLRSNRAKGILVEGIKANNKLITIDRIEESLLTSSGALQTRKIKSRIPLIGLKFTVFDTWNTANDYYSGIQNIKINGSAVSFNAFLCTSPLKKTNQMSFFLLIVLLFNL